jgi:hypothetical protein
LSEPARAQAGRAAPAVAGRPERLGFFVVEHLDSLKVRMTFRLFHFGGWFADLPRPAFGITPLFVQVKFAMDGDRDGDKKKCIVTKKCLLTTSP